jgi:hypothetical protein
MAENPDPKVSAPAESTPEPDIGNLLSGLPEFKNLFESEKKSGESAQPTEGEAPALEEPAPAESAPAPESQPEPAPPEPEPEEHSAVQKRIDELTAKRKTAEEKAAALEAELLDLKTRFSAPPPVAPTPANPLADIENMNDLAKRYELVQKAHDWAMENLEGGEVDRGEGKREFMEAAQVRKLWRQATELIRDHFPKQAAFIQKKAEHDAEAQKAYPNLFKPGTEEYNTYRSWQTVFPEARRYPDLALIVGDALRGQKIRLGQANKGKANNGNVNGEHRPLAAPAPSSAPRIPAKKALSSEELSAIATDPNGPALDNYIAGLIDQHRTA